MFVTGNIEVLKNSCSKLHCEKGLNSTLFLYEFAPKARTSPLRRGLKMPRDARHLENTTQLPYADHPASHTTVPWPTCPRRPKRGISRLWDARNCPRETTGYEPFAVHTPIQWAISGGVIKSRGRSNLRVQSEWRGLGMPRDAATNSSSAQLYFTSAQLERVDRLRALRERDIDNRLPALRLHNCTHAELNN